LYSHFDDEADGSMNNAATFRACQPHTSTHAFTLIILTISPRHSAAATRYLPAFYSSAKAPASPYQIARFYFHLSPNASLTRLQYAITPVIRF